MTNRSVRVWGSVGITVCINEDTREFVKLEIGHERIAPDDKPETLKKYEAKINAFNERAVNRRMKALKKLFREARRGL